MLARRSLLIISVVSLCASCSSPPEKEYQQAVDAIAVARARGAETYAAADFAAAESALAGYATAVNDGDYRQALARAIDARDRAHAAANTADSERLKLQNEANALLIEGERLLTAVKARLNAPAGKRPTADETRRLRQVVRTAPAQLRQGGAHIERHEFLPAATVLRTVVQSLRQALTPETPRS